MPGPTQVRRARDHGSGHAHVPEPTPGSSEAGSVVLDIGPGTGAAIVLTPQTLCGHEIEIRRAGHAWDGTHVAVRQRNGAARTQFAAIFGALAPGRYELRLREDATAPARVNVDVIDASVVHVQWPDADQEKPRRVTGASQG
jgi:hypothetical protein